MMSLLWIVAVLFIGLIGVILLPAHFGRRRLEFQELLLSLLATAARRGVPIAPLLQRAALEHTGRRRQILASAAQHLLDGHTLADALKDGAGRALPERVYSTIFSAEGTAQLPAQLQSLANETSLALNSRQRLQLALFYPVCLGLFLIGTQTIFMRFAALAREELSVNSSAAALAAVAQGEALNRVAMVVFLVTCGAVVAILLYRAMGLRLAPLQLLVRRVVTAVPALDRLRRLAVGECLLRSTAVLVATGMPLPRALRRAAPTVGDGHFAAAACAGAELMEAGAPADTAWCQTGLPLFAAVRAAAASGSPPVQLATALRALAAECNDRFTAHIDQLLRWIHPATIAVFGTLLALQFAGMFKLIYSFRQGVLW